MFEELNFTNLNETDVREEILAPLVRYLGYRSGTQNDVIREQSLRYPRAFLGRKKPGSDPILRGKADYILNANNTVRWVIEAKAPDVEIEIDSIEQAYTYANHPEVRAVYFVLSNGRNFNVYQTNQGPDQKPIFQTTYDQFNDALPQIIDLLGPIAIIRDHPGVKLDTGIPLGPGLRSVVRIANGLVRYDQNSINSKALNELQIGITEGAVERDEDGRIIAFLKTHVPIKSLQDLNERLGLASFEMISRDKQLSTDNASPTIFIYGNTIIFPAGEELLDLNTWSKIKLPRNISCHVVAEVKGILEGRKFHGSLISTMNFLEADMIVKIQGSFEIYLA